MFTDPMKGMAFRVGNLKDSKILRILEVMSQQLQTCWEQREMQFCLWMHWLSQNSVLCSMHIYLVPTLICRSCMDQSLTKYYWVQSGLSAAKGLLGCTFNALNTINYRSTTLLEAGARLVVISFLNQFIKSGSVE